MALEFDPKKLTSRVVRTKQPERIISPGKGNTRNELGEIIAGAKDFFMSVDGFIAPYLKSITSNVFSKGWGLLVSTTQFIWNFNFNATDAELDANIKSVWEGVGLQLGGAVGKALGWITCGFIPGAAIFAFNEALGAQILKEVGEEFWDEISDDLMSIFNSALRAGIQTVLTAGYKNVRNIIKSNSKLVKKMFGDKAEEAVKAWGERGSKPWTLAQNYEENLDNTFGEDGFWRNFFEEVGEEAAEACIEAGYVVANAADQFYGQAKIARETGILLGSERTVEVIPTRADEEEKIILKGNEELLKPMIVNYIAQDRMIRKKDIGTVYAADAEEVAERRFRPEVVLRFYGKKNNDPAKGMVQPTISMRISFRLMNRTVDDFKDDTLLRTLAQTIYTEFGTPPFKITKGKETYTYCDYLNGYQLRLDVENQATAIQIVKRVLDIQRHKFNDEYFRRAARKPLAQNDTKDKYTVRGKVIEVNKQKKEGKCEFVEAYVLLGVGGIEPITLVDLKNKKRSVLKDIQGGN